MVNLPKLTTKLRELNAQLTTWENALGADVPEEIVSERASVLLSILHHSREVGKKLGFDKPAECNHGILSLELKNFEYCPICGTIEFPDNYSIQNH